MLALITSAAPNSLVYQKLTQDQHTETNSCKDNHRPLMTDKMDGKPIRVGADALAYFGLDKGYRNFNHGTTRLL